MAGNADGVSYVTRSALQKRYPSYVKRHKENHMHFESFYSSIILNKDFFYYDRAVPHNTRTKYFAEEWDECICKVYRRWPHEI